MNRVLVEGIARMASGGNMTLQQLHYLIAVTECGSITEAAKRLYISQPSLSTAIKETEKEAGIKIFERSRSGISLTKEGAEFVGYARQVIQQMELLEDRYINRRPEKTRFAVSTQHYTFTTNAFVEMVERFGQERFEFILNETQTHQIFEDVRNRYSDLGVIYLSQGNEAVLSKELELHHLVFHELFTASPHVFMRASHPLAKRENVTLKDLEPYPRLNFVQGNYESSYYAEEIFSTVPADKQIRISDRGAIVNMMLGMDAYTISSGIFPQYLDGRDILAIPLDEEETLRIGYIVNEKQGLSDLGRIYVDALKKYGE